MTSTDTFAADPRDDPAGRRRFERWLLVITLAGLVLRVVYSIWFEHNHYAPAGDAFYYHWQANAIAKGHWFIDPYLWKCFGTHAQSAAHPPLYPLYLSVWSLFGGTTTLWHRIATAPLGAATVYVVGRAGYDMRSSRVGLVASFIAAFYPTLWVNDALLMSETLFALTIALLTWLAYRYLRRPTRAGAVWLGVALALTALARAEALVLAVFLVAPLLWFHHRRDVAARERVVRIALAGGMTVLLCLPIVVHNFVRFDKPVYLSNGFGGVLAVANCHETYYGSQVGLWSPKCVQRYDNILSGRAGEGSKFAPLYGGKVGTVFCRAWRDGRPESRGDESDVEEGRRRLAIDYVKAHTDRLWVVLPARLGRTFEVFRPKQMRVYADFVENRGKKFSLWGQYSFYGLSLLAIGGVVIARRRRIALLPCAAMFASAVFITLLTYGNVRFRISFDVVLPLLAALPIAAGIERLRSRDRAAPEPAGEGGSPSAP